MFDTNKVAINIKNARIRMNMTQVSLADEMNVSYQAVSNWERGNSMPDISKLPELCKILNISFEELVGDRIPETDIVEKLMNDENADVPLEDMAQIGPLVKPDKIESKIHQTIEKDGKISASLLASLAPFMDEETLNKLAEEIADIDFRKLSVIAPFLKEEILNAIIDKTIQNDKVQVNKIAAVAPFLSETSIQKIVKYLIEHGQAKKIAAIAPFIGKEMLSSQLKDINFFVSRKNEDNSCSVNSESDDLDEEGVEKDIIRDV